MQIGIVKEKLANEHRVALIPNGVKRLVALGFSVKVEAGLGQRAGFSDADYQAAGASLSKSAEEVLTGATLVLAVNKLEPISVSLLNPGTLYASLLDPFNEKALIESLSQGKISSISMEMIPRTTKAQRMDVLSSQASLAGYVAVMVAATHLPKIFPMMMTPAGTIAPTKVFVIGAGVAGLQAIATAKRLGAKVEAFDTRPVVAEQVRSLGARFVEIDLGEVGQTEQGYAKALTKEQVALQQAAMKKTISGSDVVITTAKLFGRPSPILVTKDMVKAMKAGSVIVDMAVESGGNVEGAVAGKTVQAQGVKIIGQTNLPALVATHASQMFSSNMVHLIEEVCIIKDGGFELAEQNEIVQGCLITHNGAVVNPALN